MSSEAIDLLDSDRRLEAFETIHITHPRNDQLRAKVIALMRETARAIKRTETLRTSVGNRPIKVEELMILPVIGPSGATKSTSMKTVVTEILSAPSLPSHEIPILTVTLRTATKTGRQIQAQILEAYDDPAAESVLTDRDYSEARVNEAIRAIARRKNTSVVVIDECHNPLLSTNGANARAIASLFKSIVNDGIFSLVLMGTAEMEPILRQKETRARCKEPLDFNGFTLSQRDVDYFLVFVAKLEQEMIKRKVIDRPIGLLSDFTAQAITYEMAEGVIGTVSRILKIALERVLEDRRTEITLNDVHDGFLAWKRLGHQGTADPFIAKGPRQRVLAAMEKAHKSRAESTGSH